MTCSFSSQAQIKLGFGSGYVYNKFKGLTFHMADGRSLDYDGELPTYPYKTPIYYQVMLTHWAGNSGFQLELIHNKIYATDPLPEKFQEAEVTDGYNMLFANYLIPFDSDWHLKMGAGAIITHIDVKYQDQRIHGPYEVAGFALQFGIQKDFELFEYLNWYVSVDATYSQAKPHVNHPDIDSLQTSGFSLMMNTGFEISNSENSH